MADSSKVPLWERAEEWEKNLHIFDILLVRSKGLIAKIILAAQGSEGTESPTHTAIIISEHPVLVLECVSPRVRVLPLRESLKGAEWATAYSLKDRSPETLARIEEAIRKAVMADGAAYGFWSLFKLGCRRVFQQKPARLSFRIGFGLVMPILFPILAACRLRELAKGTRFLALAEGFLLAFLGFRFVDELHYHSVIVPLFIKYFWIGWIIFLELLAWDYGDFSAIQANPADAKSDVTRSEAAEPPSGGQGPT
jgi:hypothetical protein